MANEVSYATILSNGGRVAKILANYLHTKLYDPVGLRTLMQYVPAPGMGSTVTNVTTLTRGSVMAAASTEISGGASNTALTSGNYDLTVARYLLKIQATDLFQMTGPNGGLNVGTVLSILAESLDLTITDLCVAAFANVAGNVGTSGADLTVSDFYDAIYYLNLQNNSAEGLAAVLHNVQVNDLMDSVRAEVGPAAWRTDFQGLLTAGGTGFRAQFAGVGIYQSDSCASVNTNADRRGCMFAPGAFAYQLGRIDLGLMVNPADIVVQTPEMFVERDRDAGNAMTSFIVNSYPAVSEQEDLRAVRITTDHE
jgi:hypothetical protein